MCHVARVCIMISDTTIELHYIESSLIIPPIDGLSF